MTRYNGGIIGDLNEPSGAMSATGGTVTTDGDYKVHVFTSNGTFDVTSTPSASGIFDLKSQYAYQKANKWPSGSAQLAELLMVGGGGGGGGTSNGWSANGAGAYAYQTTDYSVTAQSYSVVVGGGGSGGSPGYAGSVGTSSTFDGLDVQGGSSGTGDYCCPYGTRSGSAATAGNAGSATDITDDITGTSVTYGQTGPTPSLNSGHPSNTGNTGRGGSGSRNYGSQSGQSGRPGIVAMRYKFQ